MRSVLLVDEEALVLSKFRKIFRLIPDWTLATTDDTRRALELASNNHYDLFLVDIDLQSYRIQPPGYESMAGAQLLDELSRLPNFANQPVALFSNSVTGGNVSRLWLANGDIYLIRKHLIRNHVDMKIILTEVCQHHRDKGRSSK